MSTFVSVREVDEFGKLNTLYLPIPRRVVGTVPEGYHCSVDAKKTHLSQISLSQARVKIRIAINCKRSELGNMKNNLPKTIRSADNDSMGKLASKFLCNLIQEHGHYGPVHHVMLVTVILLSYCFNNSARLLQNRQST